MPPDAATHMFPLQPLLDAAGVTETALRRVTRCNSVDLALAREHGCTLSQADRWAIRLGFHPAEVWGDLWFGEYANEVTAA